jgi:hypothetical protein
MTSKDVVKKKESAIMDKVPDYLANYTGQGTEEVSDLVIVPRIKLLQALSPEVDEGFAPGDFFHTVAEESMGNELHMVPVFINQSVILWRPRKDGGGLLARADDGIHWDRPNEDFEVKLDSGKSVVWNTGATVQQGGLTNFGSMDPSDRNSYPAATKMINVITMFPESLDLSPAVISLQRSSFKVGQQFVSRLRINPLPSWSRVFTMTSFKDNNATNESFFNWKFSAEMLAKRGSKSQPCPLVVSKKDYPKYKEMYDHFSNKGFKASEEDRTEKETTKYDDNDSVPF